MCVWFSAAWVKLIAMPVTALGSSYPTAFVTGVSGGLGRSFAEMLLHEGVRVWGTARDADRIAPFGSPGFTPVALDLFEADAALAAFDRAQTEAGGAFDLVIQNAGYGLFVPFAAASFGEWRSQVEAMLLNTMALSHRALRVMRARNHGCLVHVSSLAAEFPLPFMSGYNVAKAGLSALSESLIFEMYGTGVTVIDFRPGDYRTGFNQAMPLPITEADPSADVRLAAAWRTLEANIASAPPPARAARDLRRALQRRRSGVVRSGFAFQAVWAPLLARMASSRFKRAVAARYFNSA